MPNQQSKKSIMPAMTPIEFNILVALVGADRHGLGIIQEVAERTSQDLFLSAATLYTALKRMKKAEWIQESEEAPPAQNRNAERRHYYRLSEQGLDALIEEVNRMECVAKSTRLILEELQVLNQQEPPSSAGNKAQASQVTREIQKGKKTKESGRAQGKHLKTAIPAK